MDKCVKIEIDRYMDKCVKRYLEGLIDKKKNIQIGEWIDRWKEYRQLNELIVNKLNR